MKVLLSAVGTTDPISYGRDSALLHIARLYKPEKIILVYSEEMLVKDEYVQQALLSIENYQPEILKELTILKNDEVYLFDKMYDMMDSILNKYLNDEDEVILNLSSGTPQIKSALFALNRINEYNTQALQVSSPNNGANRPYKPLTTSEMLQNIEENLDAGDVLENRVLEDVAEKFNQSLTKRYLRNLIASYDYVAAASLLEQNKSKKLLTRKNLFYLKSQLNDLVLVFKTQALLPDIASSSLTDTEKKAVNYFLMIDVLKKKGNVADVLIKSKSFAEFVVEEKIKQLRPNLITYINNFPKLNIEHPETEYIVGYIDREFKRLNGIEDNGESIYSVESTLNLLSYINILECIGNHDELLEALNEIKKINAIRNKIAHGLSEIDKKQITTKKLNTIITSLKFILQDTFNIDETYFEYYHRKNKELRDLIQ